MASYLAHTCTVLLQSGFFLLACYYFCISIFSLFPGKFKKTSTDMHRFAVIIPAHNEEKSLLGLLMSLEKQTYPAHLFSVFVMADQCTDRTYDVARGFHATPLLRKTTDTSGKGAALADAIHQISSLSLPFDAFVVINADNLTDPRFLEEINHMMQQGNHAVQGYIDSKNPTANWLSYAYSSWYWLTNRTIQMGFDRLGLGCKLGGTGFALSKTLLNQIPWKTSTMAEDAEYTLLLSLRNQKVAYAPNAVVYDEKPTTLSASVRQQIRWSQGITQIQQGLSYKLLKKRKWSAFFRFWSDFLVPVCFTLFLLLDCFTITNLLEFTNVPFVRLWTKPLPFLLLNLYLLGSVFTMIRGLFLDKKWSYKLLLNLFGFILYFLSWIPAGMIGILKHNKKEWYHTKHHANI